LAYNPPVSANYIYLVLKQLLNLWS